MKHYQKVQENEYGQIVGVPVSNSLPVHLLVENLY